VNTLPTSISDTSATLNGQVGDSLNGYSSLSCGFQYREKVLLDGMIQEKLQ